MTSVEDLIDALNCTIRFATPEGEYEGVLKRVFVPSRMITICKILFLPSKIKLGTLHFMFHEILCVKILNRPDTSSENDNETSLIYVRPGIEGVFNLDGDSETESECNINEILSEEEFMMELLPCFSKWISTDSQILDSFNDEFTLAIKVISNEESIGVSLEGPKISRNGILTWLCISARSCTYLFDILALGEKSFQNGLKSILENSKIKKIFHDCRLASDCLFHGYNVRLVNVFDTQVADSLVMMQESKNCSIIKPVNSLDICLSYYLQLPDDYLYSPLNFSLDKRSTYYHGLRPLQHSFRKTMIKNVIYLRLLKRELETALLIPLRRATDVYLNVIQNATDRELLVSPPVMDELPPELLLEGIQIVRYQQYEYIPPIIKSGPPCRKLANPIRDFIECCRKFQTKKELACLSSEDNFLQNMESREFSFTNISNEACSNSSQFSQDFSKCKHVSGQKIHDNIFNVNKSHNTQKSFFLPERNVSNSVSAKEGMNEIIQDLSVSKVTVCNKMPSDFGDLSIKIEQSNESEKNCSKIFIDPSAKGEKNEGKRHVMNNPFLTDFTASSNARLFLLEKDSSEFVNNSFSHENSHLSEKECKVSYPVGNCLLRPFNEMYEKDLGLTKSSTMISSELFSDTSKMLFDQGKKVNSQPSASKEFWNEIRKECVAQQSNDDQTDYRPKLRFVPAGMAGI